MSTSQPAIDDSIPCPYTNLRLPLELWELLGQLTPAQAKRFFDWGTHAFTSYEAMMERAAFIVSSRTQIAEGVVMADISSMTNYDQSTFDHYFHQPEVRIIVSRLSTGIIAESKGTQVDVRVLDQSDLSVLREELCVLCELAPSAGEEVIFVSDEEISLSEKIWSGVVRPYLEKHFQAPAPVTAS